MISVCAISVGQIKQLDYGQKREMLSALNKSLFLKQCGYQELDLLRMNRHIKTMVVHIKQYAVLANLIIKCIK